ncbi:DUF6316 family protein [Aurantivibrio plasticivorans]
MHCRTNEEEKHWYRSDRFFIANGQWYFSTREQVDIGPFGSEQAARRGLDLFIKSVMKDQNSFQTAVTAARHGEWAMTLYH